MIPKAWIEAARERISGSIETTPLTYDASEDIFIKWESCQITGSFKVRGALNRVLSMPEWERQRGLLTASAGNHGLGLAFACQRAGAQAQIFVPHNASTVKVEGIKAYGAQVTAIPGGYVDAERAAKIHAAAAGKTWVSPYNDGQVIAGQGTIVLEILADYPETAGYAWVVPVGGGGLISGIASCLSAFSRESDVIGVQPRNSPFFAQIFHQGHQENVVETDTLAEGLAGAVENGSITIPIVRKSVRDIVVVSEDELIHAMAYAWEYYGEPMEPSGAAGLAAVLSGKIKTRPAVVIVSGGNIRPDDHLNLVRKSMITHT